YLHAVFVCLPHRLMGVEGLACWGVRRSIAESAEAGLEAGTGGFLQASPAWETRGVTLHVVTRKASEQFVDGHPQSLTFDVPESKVDGAESIEFFATGGVKVAAKHHLPQTVDAEWVCADNHGGAL